MPDQPAKAVQRADQWLWFARFVKTRSLARHLIVKGKVRVNRVRISKPAHTVSPGDIVSFMAHDHVKVVEVLAIGTRKGPATEARMLYSGIIADSD